MPQLSPEALLDALRWRYAAKAFDPARKIPAPLWEQLETSLQLTPSSYGLQTWKFVVVQDPDTREKLRLVSWGQRQVTECSHFVVFAQLESLTEAYVDRYVGEMARVRNVPVEQLAGLRKSIVGDAINGPRAAVQKEWMARQSYIALGNFMTSAALLGVDTCPMEGLDPAQYDLILGLPELGYRTVVACAAGYRSAQDRFAGFEKVRFAKDELFLRR